MPDAPDTSDDLDDRVERLRDEAEEMERSGRAIPAPDEGQEDGEGVGPVTGVVP